MLLPDWLQPHLTVLPLALWMTLGLGIPWALVALPRRDWHDRPLVAALALAFGPAWLTVWMFILGTLGAEIASPLLRFDLILGGTLVIAGVGTLLAWRKMRHTSAMGKTAVPLTILEKSLISVIVLAVLLRWLNTAYWTFTAYDALWVYGYRAKVFFLEGIIPAEMGYYPPFLSLQYTFMQLGFGDLNDHAARAVIPFMHIGSILAAYVLGARLFTRRTGIFLAALWALYPHVASWAHIGDLEIPLTFTFTLTAACFLMAWHADESMLRRRYALIAGAVFGVAMWTKPTAGAFIWGVVLLVAVDLLRSRFRWRVWWQRFEVAALTGIACVPLGALWYGRNIALGHPPLVFPHESWLTRATRSGDLFGWVLVALGVTLAYLVANRKLQRRAWLMIVGYGLLLIGLLPSMPMISELLGTERLNPPQSYITLPEAALALVGAGLLALGLWRHRRYASDTALATIGWAWLLALPYFVTWFYSYSYHYRLSFPMVPLLMLPTAAVLAAWFPAQVGRKSRLRQIVIAGVTLLVGLPFMLTPLITTVRGEYNWLWTDRYPTDDSKYLLTNPGVWQTALHLAGEANELQHDLTVVAPGEQRLRFFFPQMTIYENALPTTYEELDALGATHFVYGTQARWRYEDENIAPLQNRVVASLGREDVMLPRFEFSSGTFRYELYRVRTERSRLAAEEAGVDFILPVDESPVYGDLIRFRGSSVTTNQLAGSNLFTRLIWEVVGDTERNYTLRAELVNQTTGEVAYTWENPIAPTRHGHYSSQVWQSGEIIRDERQWYVQNPSENLTPGVIYKIRLRWFDSDTGDELQATLNGEPVEVTLHPEFY